MTTKPEPIRTKTSWKSLLAVCAVAVCFVLVIDPGSKNIARQTAKKAQCAAGLHQIGLAIALYAGEHAGQYPDSFEDLLRHEQITSAVFVCPASSDVVAAGPTTAAMANEMATPHHLSYVYRGRGMHTADVKADRVIVYEHAENHDHEGMNILFGDGHVEWFSTRMAHDLIAKATVTTGP